MKKRLYAVLTVSVLLAIAACGDSTTGPSAAGEWFPATVGNWWFTSMEGYWTDTQGDTTSTWTGSFDNRITAVVQHAGGFSVYERRAYGTMTNITPDSTWTTVDTLYHYFQQTDEELRCYDDLTTTEYRIFAKFPITLNETWSHNDSSGTVLEVISLSETVNVSAGTFTDCALVRETVTLGSSEWITDHYYHRGTGNVKNIMTTDGMYGTIELQNYNVQ
ncbi:MAG: hypothetical protein KAH31_08995 [Candidatus Sabulitectum sp.]|nr:hypothetical protein [Candidatus Sabulitectum sp.]